MSSKMKLRPSTEICADCSAPGEFYTKVSLQKLALFVRQAHSLWMEKKSDVMDCKLIL